MNNQRVTQEKEKYRKRQEMVEHPFGIIKRQWGFDHVLMKGINKVEAESNLIFLCYNLKRAAKILGFKEFMKRLLTASLFSLKNDFIRTNKNDFNFSKLNFYFNNQSKLVSLIAFNHLLVEYNSIKNEFLRRLTL